MGDTRDTILWISGASGGIGGGLARNAPYPGARIINLDIVPSDEWETIHFDLTDPASWARVEESFIKETQARPDARVRFMNCAYAPIAKGLVCAVDAQDYARALIANMAGVLTLSAAFVRAVGQGHDGGLMIMSSNAGEQPLPGYSTYGPAKAAVEHWVRIVRREMFARGWGPWITAVRPGLVDTPTARAASKLDPAVFPLGANMDKRLDDVAVSIDDIAQRIWQALSGDRPDALYDL